MARPVATTAAQNGSGLYVLARSTARPPDPFPDGKLPFGNRALQCAALGRTTGTNPSVQLATAKQPNHPNLTRSPFVFPLV